MRWLLVVLVSFMAGAASFYGVLHLAGGKVPPGSPCESDAAAWLEKRFGVEAEHSEKIEASLVAYDELCESISLQIADNNSKICRLIRSERTLTPELKAAIRESGDLFVESRILLLGHVYEVGELMPDEACHAYLSWVADRVVKPGPLAMETAQP